MKKIISLFLMAVVLTAGISVSAIAENNKLIINGGFEQELFGEGKWRFTEKGGWHTEGNVSQTDSAYSGEKAIVMNNGMVYQRMELEKGITYSLSFYVKAEKDCNIDISFNDGAQEWPAINPVSSDEVTVDTEWKEVSIEFEAPNTQDYVLSIGKWEEQPISVDDVNLTEAPSYISKLKTGIDGDGVISFQADYTDTGTFIIALYDNNGKLTGVRTQKKTGSFDAVKDYGVYTVKAYLLGDDLPLRTKTEKIEYDENSRVNENYSVGPAKELKLSEHNINLNIGADSAALDADIFPIFAFDKNIIWTSSDENVAAVSQNGIITPVGEGTAVITAKSGSLSDSCTVTVTQSIEANGITLSKSSIILPEIDSVYALSAEVTPAGAEDKLVWESSNPSVASVLNGVVTANEEGTAVITASTENGKYSAKCALPRKMDTKKLQKTE